ncbi:D-amino-acid transaminase [Oceanisphaera pacifica]|uniref:D-alanine aminotransferase n=1 Tax=Oceanisphaera pacifica TaxID=2818389 RepID=A0ABS3NHD9_9GAMM|nr:D-amino-acid transaminase [Oceanisphaera pacifica]MBO1519997.1 D-amino-acid transaminase [Oceanisphaera pacifica]
MKVLVNNTIESRENVAIDIEDRGYQFGDGVYEVVRVYEGEVYELDGHVERFFRSAQEIDITLSYTVNELKENIKALIAENNVVDGGIYFQVTRGVSPRKHSYDRTLASHLIAYPLYFTRPKEKQLSGVTAITVDDLRWLRCDIKSLNLLYNVMMKQKAQDNKAFEGIFVRDDVITEGTSTNVFIVKDGVYKTHPASNMILNGITRQRILSLLSENNFTVEEVKFTKAELLAADEVFITSTTSEVMPIIEIDNQIIGQGQVGDKTKQIYNLLINYIG